MIGLSLRGPLLQSTYMTVTRGGAALAAGDPARRAGGRDGQTSRSPTIPANFGTSAAAPLSRIVMDHMQAVTQCQLDSAELTKAS